MRSSLFVASLIVLLISFPTFAQSAQVTAGRFFLERGSPNQSNASISGSNFSALSSVSDSGLSVWNICEVTSSPAFCKAGTSFSVPTNENLDFGVCGACNPPQFALGTFTLNGTTYDNVYFKGKFQFPQVTFAVSPMFLNKRKGIVRFRKPFTMSGNFEVCSSYNELYCPAQNIIYSGPIGGHGTLSVIGEVNIDTTISSLPFLRRKSIEYRFEP